MILREEELIKTNLKINEFGSKFSKLCRKYLPLVYSNYLFFSFENTSTKQRLAFNTNAEWYKNFIDLKLIDQCPLYAATSYFNNSSNGASLYLWNQIIPEGRAQRNVVGLRREHNIANGISVSCQQADFQFILGLATDPKDHELEEKYKNIIPIILALFYEAKFICLSEFKKAFDAKQ